MADGAATTRANPKAEEAFSDYVRLGAARSLEALAAEYRSRTDPVPTKQLSRLKVWSTTYHWQDRIVTVRSEQAERDLQEASILDADTFLQSSRLLNERMKYATRDHADAIVKMRESVRKPAPKGGASVSVNISVEVRQLAERLAKELGMSADELLADAEKIAAGAWGDA